MTRLRDIKDCRLDLNQSQLAVFHDLLHFIGEEVLGTDSQEQLHKPATAVCVILAVLCLEKPDDGDFSSCSFTSRHRKRLCFTVVTVHSELLLVSVWSTLSWGIPDACWLSYIKTRYTGSISCRARHPLSFLTPKLISGWCRVIQIQKVLINSTRLRRTVETGV